jgi:copper chaperone CopZ
MKTKELRIEGMTCGHCVMSVKRELAKLAGLQVESVEIGKARVHYDDSKVSDRDVEQAIQEAGYRLAPLQS